MEKYDMSRIKLVVALVVGLIILVVAIGMFRSPSRDIPTFEAPTEQVNFIEEGVTQERPIATPIVVDIDVIEVVSEDFSDLPQLDMSAVKESMLGPFLRRIPAAEREGIPFEVIFLEQPTHTEVALVGGDEAREFVNEEGLTIYLVETNINLPTLFAQDNHFVRINLGEEARIKPDNLGERLFEHLPYANEQVVIEVMLKGADETLIEDLTSMSSWHSEYQESAAEGFDGFLFLEINPLLVLDISDMPEVIHIYYFSERPTEPRG